MKIGPKDIRFGLVSRTGKMVKQGYKSRREAENAEMEVNVRTTTVGYISNRRRQHHGK